jgi:hypothetical protein
MHNLAEQRIVAPGYSTMQDIVGGALIYEQRRLTRIAQVKVSPSAGRSLQQLLENKQGLHEITLLKRNPRDFSNREIKREVQRKEEIRELYRLSRELLPHLEISTENIGHYASLVDYYSVHRLRQLSGPLVHVLPRSPTCHYSVKLKNYLLCKGSDWGALRNRHRLEDRHLRNVRPLHLPLRRPLHRSPALREPPRRRDARHTEAHHRAMRRACRQQKKGRLPEIL